MSTSGIKRSPSFFDHLTSPTVTGSKLLLESSICFSHILSSSHGRDKILGVIQYSADLYKQCMLEFLSETRIRKWPLMVRNASIIYESMRSGRKIFQLLRWIEEVSSIGNNLKEAFSLIVFMKILRHVAGTIYYILDNFVWISNIGVISDFVLSTNWKWESTKDSVSFIRYWLLLMINLTTENKRRKKELALIEELKRKDERVVSNDNWTHKELQSLIKIREKRRFQTLVTVKNVLRLIMLVKSLEMPGSEYISNIFYSFCGVISSAIAIFKYMTMKKIEKGKEKKTIKEKPLEKEMSIQ
ncbi:unnamed protein product [Blepharisma stoltei]|uniref:Uncharacterized protein n=1 Tax=Blepharisma stoltei TaxID=1481888 RepID=A0AAU9J1C7_9CILI|nr:unnamed protein product [Blepharisma stoltei]